MMRTIVAEVDVGGREERTPSVLKATRKNWWSCQVNFVSTADTFQKKEKLHGMRTAASVCEHNCARKLVSEGF